MKKLPIYKLIIKDEGVDTGVDYVALVDEPAIQMNWHAFNNKRALFKTESEDKRIISGALMVAEMPIYRRDERGEYYVVFDKQTIEQIVHKFMKNGYLKNVNMMHDNTAKVDGVYMFESFIIDASRGIKTPEGFDSLTDGSWFGSFKVDNEEVWQEFIKTGIFKGFSVEGVFQEEYVDHEEDVVINAIIEALTK
jgi:hypothetical protein